MAPSSTHAVSHTPFHGQQDDYEPAATIQTSTLAMSFENPSSASLALSAQFEDEESTPHHPRHHSHHLRRHSTTSAGSRPVSISEKLEAISESENQEEDGVATMTVPSELKRNGGSLSSISGSVTEVGEPSSASPHENVAKILDYPEGGFGWLVVLASFIVNFWCFGGNITFGVYQDYFLQAGSFNGALATQLSWVGSIGTAAMFIPGPFVAPMTRFMGLRAVVLIGIAVASLGFILASFASQLWHLYLTQGLMFGCGGGLVFFSSISVTAQYFEKRRGLANGIAVSGSGIGGLALAPLTRFLLTKVGIHWCQRIIGFCILGFLLAIFAFIKPRVKTVKTGAIFDFSLFRVQGFGWLMMTAFVVTFGYMVPVFLVPTYSNVELNQTSTTGANLISIYSGINAVARIGLGVAADRLGRTNTLFTCCFMAGLSCLAVWSVSSTISILTGFMVLYGVFGGGFISIFPVVVAQVVGVERLSAALGILYFGNVVGNLLGAPIATAIMKAQGGRYIGAIIFAGLSPMVAAFFVLFIRFRLNKKIFAIA
ncbi:hypothetical protein EMPS_06817 [Entomortierella parvispora]|uniref:Major facilitator superfamily (MFS) profile domain-containing protein n=1 Tax=Entomortierella parvispora TaxID=205924 RepID=A0A9P3HD51_9FUNG|nr:hypothetical protein EMPS_06817 [Entomortierella parvispora]